MTDLEPVSPPAHAIFQPAIAYQMLAEAQTIPEVKHLHDGAATFRDHVRRQRLGFEQAFQVAEYQLRAECRLGAMLADLMGARSPYKREVGTGKFQKCSILGELGITWWDSERWQTMAAVLEAELDEYFARKRAEHRLPTQTGIETLGEPYVRKKREEVKPNLDGCGPDEDDGKENLDDLSGYPERTILWTTQGEKKELAEAHQALSADFGTDGLTDTLLKCVRLTRRIRHIPHLWGAVAKVMEELA